MASESTITTDHETIRKWAETRGGKPATVKGTERGGEVGILRIEFPGHGGEESLEEISWDDFFRKFDEKNLVFRIKRRPSAAMRAASANLSVTRLPSRKQQNSRAKS